MLSAIPAVLSTDSVLGNPFPSFENGFTPWDSSEFLPISAPPSPKPVGSTSGSDEPDRSDHNPTNSNNSVSDDPNQANSNSNSGSDDQNQTVSIIDERKRRRMLSNRESARRSRMRKQKHLENLRNQVNRLRVENRELTNRLRFVLYHCHRVKTDNDRLRSEHSMLRQKLSNIRQILMIRQLQQVTSPWPPCNNIITNQQIAPSLITS